MKELYELVDHILYDAVITVVTDALHLDAMGTCVRDVNIGTLLTVETAAHTDIAKVRCLRHDIGFEP